MSDTDHLLKSTDITRTNRFALKPDADARKGLATEMDILGVRKLVFEGSISPDGKHDLVLEAKLGATVIQECGVTGAPVTTRIDEPVTRRFVAGMTDPEGEEAEMPEDDTVEPLPEEIDLGAVMAEALALALPPWPRAEGVEPVEISVTEPGKAPMTDDDARPFAALKQLRDGMDDTGSDGA